VGKLSKSYLKEVAERKKFQSGGFSTQGYKRNSPDVNNPYNVIPSNQITMRGVDFPVLGVDNMGNRRLMKPGNDYTFPGNYVTEFPIKNMGSKRFGQVGMQKKDIPKYVEDRYQVQNTTDNTYSVPFTPLPKPVPVRNVKAPANLTNSRYQPSTTDNTYLVPPTALPKPTPAQLLKDFEIAVETEATEKEQQRLQAEREAAAKTREAVVEFGDESAKFTFPDGKTKAWKDMDWREQAYVSGKNLGSWSAGNWTDYINPAAMIGSLAEGLGSAPYVARETDSIMPYVTGIGSPLLTGALGGIGAKTTGQFVNNLANPLAGINSSLTSKVGNTLYNLQQSLPTGRIKDNILGASKGIHDIASGRPFFETFPITGKQRRAVEAAQDKAFEEGLEFVKEWNYPRNIFTLRPEVSTRIQNIFPEVQGLGTNMQPFFKRNPIYTANNLLVNSKTSSLAKNPNISNEAKQYILSRRGKIGGVNMGGTNESITLRNHGFYYNPPSRIKDVAAHELGHSMQKLGTDFGIGWGHQIATSHPDYKYHVANLNTPFGRYMGDAMVKPVKGRSIWEASPLEPHSELMAARMNVFEGLMRNSNFTPNQVMQLLQNPDDALTDILIKRGNLDRFFEPTTSQQVKRNIVRALPVVGAGVLQQNLDQPTERTYQTGGQKSPVILPQLDYDLTQAPKQGNFLLSDIDRPFYIDDDGYKRSEFRMGINVDGRETLIPTVVNGQQLSPDQAIDRYYQTGLHMGQYNTPEESDYASRLRTMKYNMLEDPVRFGTNYQMGGTMGIPRVNGQVVSSQPQLLTSVRRTRGPLQKNNKGDVKTMPKKAVKNILKNIR
jgi:hypothetical protein